MRQRTNRKPNNYPESCKRPLHAEFPRTTAPQNNKLFHSPFPRAFSAITRTRLINNSSRGAQTKIFVFFPENPEAERFKKTPSHRAYPGPNLYTPRRPCCKSSGHVGAATTRHSREAPIGAAPRCCCTLLRRHEV